VLRPGRAALDLTRVSTVPHKASDKLSLGPANTAVSRLKARAIAPYRFMPAGAVSTRRGGFRAACEKDWSGRRAHNKGSGLCSRIHCPEKTYTISIVCLSKPFELVQPNANW